MSPVPKLGGRPVHRHHPAGRRLQSEGQIARHSRRGLQRRRVARHLRRQRYLPELSVSQRRRRHVYRRRPGGGCGVRRVRPGSGGDGGGRGGHHRRGSSVDRDRQFLARAAFPVHADRRRWVVPGPGRPGAAHQGFAPAFDVRPRVRRHGPGRLHRPYRAERPHRARHQRGATGYYIRAAAAAVSQHRQRPVHRHERPGGGCLRGAHRRAGCGDRRH